AGFVSIAMAVCRRNRPQGLVHPVKQTPPSLVTALIGAAVSAVVFAGAGCTPQGAPAAGGGRILVAGPETAGLPSSTPPPLRVVTATPQTRTHQVVLRGVNLSATEFVCEQGGTYDNRGYGIYGGPFDQVSTYQAMAAWHVNVVRVPLNEDCWLGINGVNPSYGGVNYQQAIEAEVAAIHQAGLYAILDLHWTSPGGYAAVTQQPMADTDHSIAFWQSVASTFKSDPAVIFDLFNEPFFYGSYLANPNQDPWQCWLNGCAMTQFISGGQTTPTGQSTGYTTTYSWQSAGMQQLLDAVRGTGATEPVLINGVGWGGDDSGWLAHAPSDPAHQLIAGAHMYPCSNCGPISTSAWDSEFGPIGQQYPVLFGETGDSSAGPETYLPTFLPWADSHNWGYLAWTWNPWSNPDFVLIKDWNGTPTTGEGAYYQAHLAQVARVSGDVGVTSGQRHAESGRGQRTPPT
ncbi:MAG TPA: cellulase family glycosylhydrolase, partial [Mycobacterium sp.]|nr:cellulase family glycosylhydrolase [Mycobacterium sp.]